MDDPFAYFVFLKYQTAANNVNGAVDHVTGLAVLNVSRKIEAEGRQTKHRLKLRDVIN